MNIPTSLNDLAYDKWSSFAPFYTELETTELTPATQDTWLYNWSQINKLLYEAIDFAYVKKAADTSDAEAEGCFMQIMEEVLPAFERSNQRLKQRLLQLSIDDPDMDVPLRNLRGEASLFREENVSLQTAVHKLSNEYDKITGGLSAEIDGETLNVSGLSARLYDKNREKRQQAWQAQLEIWLAVRPELNRIYSEMLSLRCQIANNADLPDYREYAFQEKARFDYTPEDCFVFHEAIETAVVPAAQRIYAKKQARLGLDALKPWDMLVDTSDAPTLSPYQTSGELTAISNAMFEQVSPQLGSYFKTMADEGLLDLQTRPNKSLGAFCAMFPMQERPFIFMNGTGLHDDVQTLLHEAGHAFHAFSCVKQPLVWQTEAPMEFCEVASMAMELLAAPYLSQEKGGFYTPEEMARARIEHLEGIITFLPYMAVVDAFQHWVYTHPKQAVEPAQCDAQWGALWDRFMKGVDWSDFPEEKVTGWHRKGHIFSSPFYYIEYGMAQVGALQIWRNSLQDPQGALVAYQNGLAHGGTKTLPDLFTIAGAEFRFDTNMLTELVSLVENTVSDLEKLI